MCSDMSWLRIRKTTHLVLASQVDGECEADDENSEVCVPNWSPHAQILDHPINDWSTKGLKLKLVRVKVDQPHYLLLKKTPHFMFYQIYGEKEGKTLDHVITLWGEECWVITSKIAEL